MRSERLRNKMPLASPETNGMLSIVFVFFVALKVQLPLLFCILIKIYPQLHTNQPRRMDGYLIAKNK